MSNWQDEKQDEKQEEKAEKEEKDRGGWDEKWRRDPLSGIVWALIFVWAGLVLLASNLGFLVRFERLDTWSLILLGAGGIVLLEVLVRLVMPAYRRPVGGSVILAAVLIGIGLGGIVGWQLTWPLILIAVGVLMLLRAFVWRR